MSKTCPMQLSKVKIVAPHIPNACVVQILKPKEFKTTENTATPYCLQK